MDEMKPRRQPVNTGIGVGGSSVLTVFVVLCLTTFAVLSLVSSRADLRLSKKAAQSVTAYYEADAQGQRLLSRLGGLTGEADSLTSQAEELEFVTDCRTDAEGAILVRFSIPVTESQTLAGEADLSPLLTGGTLRLLKYRVVVEEYESGAQPNLLEGTLPAGVF